MSSFLSPTLSPLSSFLAGVIHPFWQVSGSPEYDCWEGGCFSLWPWHEWRMQDILSSCHASLAWMVEDGFMWQGQGYACTLRHLGPLTKGLLHPASSAVYFFYFFIFCHSFWGAEPFSVTVWKALLLLVQPAFPLWPVADCECVR